MSKLPLMTVLTPVPPATPSMDLGTPQSHRHQATPQRQLTSHILHTIRFVLNPLSNSLYTLIPGRFRLSLDPISLLGHPPFSLP